MSQHSTESFFPKYLNQGSVGPAVVVLQVLLTGFGYYRGPLTDIYDKGVALAVEQLQRRVGASVDGNFGPETRDKLAASGIIDINALQISSMHGPTMAMQPDRNMIPWPEPKAAQ